MNSQECNMEFTGERFVPEVHGQIELEHLHRYLQACEIATGKVVLDIASGEGYGSALLSRKAIKVFGVDISLEAVEHARRRYKNENIEFKIGSCADIPLPNASVDMVVSFETIEHHDQHDQMMREVKRVLRADGILLISSPDKYHYSDELDFKNPYHIKELYQHEFKQLLSNYYKNIVYFGQRIIYGSGILAESLATPVLSYWSENNAIRSASGITKPLYWIALASDIQLPELTSGVFEQHINESEIVHSWRKEVTNRNDQIEKLNQVLAERDGQIANLNQVVAEHDTQVRAFKNSASWRLTRPFRFVARLVRYGFTNEDRQRITQVLRSRYHSLPLPASVKGMARSAYHWVYRNNLRAFPRSALRVTQFHAPTIRPLAQQHNKPDYVVWGVIDWHFRHQRPQQLALALAASGRRVFYISEALVDDERAGFEAEALDDSGKLFQVKLFAKGAPSIYSDAPAIEIVTQLRRSIGEVLDWAGCKQIVSLVDHPFWYDIASVLPNSRLVYDCMDHHEGFGSNAESMLQLEKKLLSEAELTITTSTWLDDALASHAAHRALIRNAGEYKHFANVPDSIYRDPRGRRIIGYYGAIAEWFDLDLVEAVARQQPDCSVLLVGADTVNARSRLAKLHNVTFTGEVAYSQLPHYLHGFDVCLLPFKVIPLTLATNPVKAYEYLGTGKPIVTVDLPEMAQFNGLVYAAAGKDAFLAAVSKVLSKPEPDSLIQQRKAFAEGQTWQHRAEALIQHAESTARDPKVSVVVVTYNNMNLTRECLESLDEYSQYEPLEIIVVDNASSDGSPAFLSEWVTNGHNRKLILNEDNRGFSAANNQGLAAATGEYLVMLNNDTYVTPGWIRTLVRHLQRDRTIGLIGPVTNNIGNEAKIDIAYEGMDEMRLMSATYTHRHIGQIYPLRTAAFFCVMMPRTTYERVGALDEAFGQGFFEDDDYCRRIEQHGLRVVCAEDVFVHHHLSASFNKLKQQDRQKLFENNKKTYEAKWGRWAPHEYR